MPSWAEVVRAEPELALTIERLFALGRHKTIATLRADGSAEAISKTVALEAASSPRLSGLISAVLAQTLTEDEKTVLGALEDTENALLSYAKQQAQLKFRLEQSVAARRAAELAEIRYRAGSSDFLTLLDAQRTQLAADDALAQAEAGVNVGVVAIYKSLGGWGEQDVAPALAAQP